MKLHLDVVRQVRLRPVHVAGRAQQTGAQEPVQRVLAAPVPDTRSRPEALRAGDSTLKTCAAPVLH